MVQRPYPGCSPLCGGQVSQLALPARAAGCLERAPPANHPTRTACMVPRVLCMLWGGVGRSGVGSWCAMCAVQLRVPSLTVPPPGVLLGFLHRNLLCLRRQDGGVLHWCGDVNPSSSIVVVLQPLLLVTAVGHAMHGLLSAPAAVLLGPGTLFTSTREGHLFLEAKRRREPAHTALASIRLNS